MFSSRAGYADVIAGHVSAAPPEQRTPSPMLRNGSVASTRAVPFSAAVNIERAASSQSDDDIIFVTVRLTNKDRRQSYDDALPMRPPKRSFLRRVGTRILPPADEDKFTAVRMPRGDYKRYFQKDEAGNYAGTEPQREWDEVDIDREFGMYKNLPIGSPSP